MRHQMGSMGNQGIIVVLRPHQMRHQMGSMGVHDPSLGWSSLGNQAISASRLVSRAGEMRSAGSASPLPRSP
eukprot:4308097-Prymnesium_polylepis.1